MDYGTQRFLDTKPLTPEQKARQTLALEAIREQARYERNKRKQLVNTTKEAVIMLGRFTMIVLLSLILIALVSCNKEESIPTYEVEPELQPYVDMFLEDAVSRGIDVSRFYTEDVCIMYTNTRWSVSTLATAWAWKLGKTGVRIEVYKPAFDEAYDVSKKLIIYHELGHDFFDLPHNDNVFIMFPVLPARLVSVGVEHYDAFFNLAK